MWLNSIMFLDIGIGILLALVLGDAFNVELTRQILLFALVSSLLPDLDVLLYLSRGGKMDHKAHKHRSFLHYPLFYIFIGLGLSVVLPFWGTLFTLASLAHFLHDSIGIGWGVQWLYPFSSKYIALFVRYREDMPRTFVCIWSPKEVEELSAKRGDKNWFKNIYIKLQPYAIVEILVFVIALVFLWFNLK